MCSRLASTMSDAICRKRQFQKDKKDSGTISKRKSVENLIQVTLFTGASFVPHDNQDAKEPAKESALRELLMLELGLG